MATQNLSPAPPPPARSAPYPKASPGYGKRAVPDQSPPRADDFAFLPERERHIAGYVDRLPDGAAMNIKSLAKCLTLYGQMAVGSALRALGVAGHLRHVRCAIGDGEGVRWVTRTFWSRTARDNEWWTAFLAAEETRCVPQPGVAPVASVVPPPPWVPAEPTAPAAPEPPAQADSVPPRAPAPAVPQQRTEPSRDDSPAYLALARLGRVETRLGLSDGDCRELEQMAAEWFARGVDADYLTHALTAGIPHVIDSPVGFVRGRLLKKLPPHVPAAARPDAPDAPVRRLMIECTDCGTPGKAEAFRDGLCGPCRRPAQTPAADQTAADEPGIERDIQAHVKRLREQLKMR
ncbi:MarR family transcriptional regulator [Streptomyces sp. NPDC005426]|uniref:MarR family transcriptional regulator n=1 Tax=Streptomyces sp. NPDC005426 TaxID=3155344 RepID=UPI0033BAE5A1